jgi:predicted ATPase
MDPKYLENMQQEGYLDPSYEAAEAINRRKKLFESETKWVPEPIPEIPPEDRMAIGLGQKACPCCGSMKYPPGPDGPWNNLEYTLILKGQDTGLTKSGDIVRCRCRQYRMFYPEMLRTVPVHYQDARLSTLKPNNRCRLSAERQQQNIDLVCNNRGKNVIFSGPAGTGKTTFMYALYQNALHERVAASYVKDQKTMTPPSVWMISVRDLFDQFHKQVTTQQTFKPVVTRDAIHEARMAGFKPCVFLQEIDKTGRMTENRSSALFSIFDGIYENDGQLVLDTNLSLAELADHLRDLDKTGDEKERGPILLRRMVDENGLVVNLYE